MEETSPLMEKEEAKKRGEEKVGVVGEVDMVLILHEKVAIKMGSENTFVFWKQKQCTTHHHHSPRSPFFMFFYLFVFVFTAFQNRKWCCCCLEHACINSTSHHPIIHHTSSSHQRHQHQREREREVLMHGDFDASCSDFEMPQALHQIIPSICISAPPPSLSFVFFSFLFFSFLVVKSSVTVVTIRSQKIPPPSSPVSAMMVTSFSWALQFQLDVIASLNKKKKSINIKNIYIFVPNWHSSWGKLNSTALWVFNYFIFRSM